MDWSRTGSLFELTAWLVLCGMWSAGGWLIARQLFRLRPREVLFAGISIGLLLFIVTSNLLARIFTLEVSFWIAAIILLFAGALARFRQKTAVLQPACSLGCLAGQVAGFILLLIFFIEINSGLSIFDDNNNLPLISRLSAGDFPPHFYLNPELRLDYHYGLHLFAASLVQVAGFYPWSAFDIAKALSLAQLAILAWLWFRRQVRPRILGLFGVIFVFLATGTRWLLLVIPEKLLVELSARIQLTGSALASGPELFRALVHPWIIEGGSPVHFPFAFSNGIIPPAVLSLTGYGALPYLTAVLLLLIIRRENTNVQKFAAGLVLSSLAITGEHLFFLAWTGILLAVVISWLANHPTRGSFKKAVSWSWLLAPGLVVAFSGGGVLTEYLDRNFLNPDPTLPPGIGFGGITLRFPPGITSAHLGNLSFFDPAQLLVAAMEIGPLLLLAVPVFYYASKRSKEDRVAFVGMSLAAAVGLVLPLLIQLSLRDRDISRMSGMSLFILMVLGFPLTVLIWKSCGTVLKTLLVAGYGISIIGGIAMLPSLLVAAARPQSSYFITQLDQQMAKIYWNTLAREASVFDPGYTYRPAVVFASSAGRAYQDIYTPYPAFASLLANPHPRLAASQGYANYYLDRDTWDKLPPEIQAAFSDSCMQVVAEFRLEDGDFRKLYDIQGCQE